MGYTMRTDRFRYTEWMSPQNTRVGRELYDHQLDPGETVNLADRDDSAGIVERLSDLLHAGWKAALPPR